jgi:hypothetical protein
MENIQTRRDRFSRGPSYVLKFCNNVPFCTITSPVGACAVPFPVRPPPSSATASYFGVTTPGSVNITPGSVISAPLSIRPAIELRPPPIPSILPPVRPDSPPFRHSCSPFRHSCGGRNPVPAKKSNGLALPYSPAAKHPGETGNVKDRPFKPLAPGIIG